MYEVTRQHEIACGHRVYGHESKCAHLHGHNYLFHLTCEPESEANMLDGLGRVIDFSVIKRLLCEWLERNWDHRFLVWEKDPAAVSLLLIDQNVVTVPFNPTAENMAAYLVREVGPLVFAGTGVVLSKVVIEETRKCSASFTL